MTQKETVFLKDIENKKLTVTRVFDASLEQVWKAWTESEILDQWWGPKPYRAETKIMDFKEGGFWLYEMIGPGGDVTLCKERFKTIDVYKTITNAVTFCDKDGNDNPDFPTMYWKKQFIGDGSQTKVLIEIAFDKLSDLETIIKMRFQEGLTAGLSNLDDYLSVK